MSLPSYKEYRPSGVEWLGEVPSHWEVKRLKYVGKAIGGLTYDPSEIVEEGNGTLVLRSSNVQNGRIVFDDNVYVTTTIPDKIITQDGDILICSRNGSRSLIGKNAKIDHKSSGLTFGAFMMIFRTEYSEYIVHVFNSQLFKVQSGLFLTATINQLTSGDLYSMVVPLPPADEQHTIAAFLDRETNIIDTLIAEQKRLVELLAEKRQAMISHAVTKGINPNAQMKDSGIEWLGEVPSHWEITRLKRACNAFPSNVDKKSHEGEISVQLCNYTDVYYNDIITTGMELMVVTASQDQIAKFTLRAGDTIITKDSETADDIAISAYVPSDLPGVICGYHLSLIRPLQDTVGAFIKRLFDSTYAKSCFEVRANGLTRVGLGQYEIDNLELPFPPRSEQTQIAAFLDKESAKFDALTAEANRAIELLQEHRSALISAAVTGKIDVRGANG